MTRNVRCGSQAELCDLVLDRRAVITAHAVVVAGELLAVGVAEAHVLIASALLDLAIELVGAGVHDANSWSGQRSFIPKSDTREVVLLRANGARLRDSNAGNRQNSSDGETHPELLLVLKGTVWVLGSKSRTTETQNE